MKKTFIFFFFADIYLAGILEREREQDIIHSHDQALFDSFCIDINLLYPHSNSNALSPHSAGTSYLPTYLMPPSAKREMPVSQDHRAPNKPP
ncbi:hypothetical protein CCUS01_16232 [Colletotrichum cuscutae]|uniref:Uncharacterized protein n=1 Tax=Colletotrichum cuscutae TaxID=1209917 RepID=A0AAI9Y683_9PEZI|nr:hypothetical protein CCUS01_16232 [Colletotrichum cuscutae]